MKPNRQNRLVLPAISLAGFALAVSYSHAADLTWDTNSSTAGIQAGTGSWNTTAGNTVWSNAGNNVIWSQTSTTDGSNAAIFAGTDGTLNQYVVTLGSQMAAESITFNNSGYQITGSTLALMPTTTTNGAITVAGGKTATINSVIAYANNQPATITVNSGAVLNLGGGANNSQYTFNGAGTINITGGTYEANIGAINAGNFNISGGNYNITPGASNGYNFGNAVARNVDVRVSGTGTLSLNNTSTNTTALAPFIAVGNNTSNSAYTTSLTVQAGGTVTVGTQASRAGEIRISNSGNANGLFDVQGGTVNVGNGNAANKIYFFKAGASSGYSATMTQSGGTVTANGLQFGGDTGSYDAASSATMHLSGGSLYVGAQGITRGSAASTLPVGLRLQGGTLGASADWSSSLDMKLTTVTLRAADSGSVARNITLSGVLSGDDGVNGSFTKSGAGTLALSNIANTFSGQVLSDAGTLQVSSLANAGTVSSLGTGAASSVVRLGNNAAATLEYVGTTDSSTNRSIQIGTNAATNTGSATVLNNSASGKLTFSATNFNPVVSGVTVARVLTLGGSNAADNTISGRIADHGGVGGTISVVKQDAGKWILGGSNTYSGLTTISGGTLALGHATDTLDGAITVNGGTLDVDNPDTVGVVTLTSGTISGDSVLTASSYAVESGTISTVLGGSGDLTKTGAGTVTLNAATTYTGNTTLSAGTLALGASGGIASSGRVSIAQGATLDVTAQAGGFTLGALQVLAGGGAVAGDATILGNHAPGFSPGEQTFNGDLTYGPGASIDWELAGNTTTGRGASWDAITVIGDLSFHGATTLIPNFAASGSTVSFADTLWSSALGFNGAGWRIFDVTGAVSGLSNLSIGGSPQDSNGTAFSTAAPGLQFTFYEQGGGVYLTTVAAIPEPGSVLALAAALSGGVLLRRRRF
jgi:fibronectin-binding autotransporter adhesin